ncbi:hypothetical protein, partial [Caballeronia pedi]|uniref:hypothetical protein n=1 Tax=Caballeronia pedi TaxID=1777141 RepID=UPI001ABF287C
CFSPERLKPHSLSSAHTYRLLVFKEHCAENLLRELSAFACFLARRHSTGGELCRLIFVSSSVFFQKSYRVRFTAVICDPASLTDAHAA